MLFVVSPAIGRILFGITGSWLELVGSLALVLGIVGYAVRLAWYSLAAVHQPKKVPVSSDDEDHSQATYSGPYCAG